MSPYYVTMLYVALSNTFKSILRYRNSRSSASSRRRRMLAGHAPSGRKSGSSSRTARRRSTSNTVSAMQCRFCNWRAFSIELESQLNQTWTSVNFVSTALELYFHVVRVWNGNNAICFVAVADKKKLALAEKFKELKKSGKIEKYMQRKRKKNASKEKKKLPRKWAP